MSTPSPSNLPLCLLSMLLAGCATYRISIPAYPVHPAAPSLDHFTAGAGKAEITPPPGIPMGGHGPAGRVARGYWTRLHARSFYFDDGRGHRLALVSAELFAIPAGLHAKVLQAVNRSQRLLPEELVLAASHTHHGPANFASAEIYNSFAGPLPNFDPVLLDFLAAQIASAIVDSIADAHATAARPHELRFYRGSAPGVQRNRAIAPFFANPDALRAGILQRSLSLGATCPDGTTQGCPRYLAVDPALQLIEILRDGKPRALLLFFAVHPTSITHDADLYSGDLAGIACAMLEKDRAPVAGFFNGAEGDISPDWLAQDRDDAIHLAGRLATPGVDAAAQEQPRAQRTRFQADTNPRIEVRRKTVANNWRDTDGVGFASKPMCGAAELGGAEDGRTIFYNYGWRAEARKPAPSGEHGPKEPGLEGPVASALESVDSHSLAKAVKVLRPARFLSPGIFPALVPVTWAQLGSFSFAAIPVEATTAAGWAIRQAARADVILGLANEYIGYTTSAPEYEAQQYEGASTLLGPGQAAGLARLLALAAAGRGDPPSGDTVPARTFSAGPRRKNAFGPETLLVRRQRNMVDEDLEPLLPRQFRRLEARIPRFDWDEEPAGDWHADARQVAIYSTEEGVWREKDTDRGLNFLTVLAEADKSRRRYTALWIPPDSSPRQFLFRVRSATGKQVCSLSFTLADIYSAAPVPPVPQADCPEVAPRP
ncbi:MAG: neutral/alkaline non-lysosomal ceramidase N-terminal domain-containing protein [Candidatus Solibacter sp.]|nr:neutral/alkaline non-lysosomal ceramidase N-terminal domain-containing protein [Candidatus Solibacter sp.]